MCFGSNVEGLSTWIPVEKQAARRGLLLGKIASE
jgi:hypothetical protein